MASVAKQLQMKLALEKRFRPEIKRVFAAMLQDFRASVAATGLPPQARRYTPAWVAVLDGHYRRTQKLFSGVVSKSKKQNDEESDAELLALALLAWRDKNAPVHAELLTSTTQSNMSEALETAGEQFALEGKIATNREMAAAATAILRKRLRRRTEAIIMSETQAASESTKFIEAEVSTGIQPRILGGGLVVTTSTKTWRTVGDKRVRPMHRDRGVNGQTRLLTEPFVVNNQLLMHPGDSSLGASVENVINCRCVSQYSIK